MKKLKFVLFVFFVSSLLIAQEAQTKGGAKNINKVTKAPAKTIDDTQGVIKQNNNITVVTYDFTVAGAAYVNSSIEPGVFAMWNGDTNGDGSITNADKALINSTKVFVGYHIADLNFDGSVTNADKAVVNTNKPTTPQTHVPN